MTFAIVVCFLTVSYAAQFKPELNSIWENFKGTYGKNYTDSEEEVRRLIWEENVAMIMKHNLEYNLGKHSYSLGLNEYADLTQEEFVSTMNGYKHSNESIEPLLTSFPPSNVQLPSSVDWRNKGLVTPVKNQKACGSCWAFSSTGSLEGQHKKKTGKLVSLSEQNLVDCSRPDGAGGCKGGWMGQAFNYIKRNGGIDTESSYPYEAADKNCRFKRNSIGATLKGYVYVKSGDEGALQKATANVGPISVAIDASFKFQMYRSGVYDEPRCSRNRPNHAVLIVGYGSENRRDYWLVKNSWGKGWGSNGYIKMSRNKQNQCGIASYGIYPVV